MSDSLSNRHGTTITVGQVWADNDSRAAGRTVRIDGLERGFDRRAICTVLTEVGGTPVSRPREVRIKIDRLHPNSTGYRLLTDYAAGETLPAESR